MENQYSNSNWVLIHKSLITITNQHYNNDSLNSQISEISITNNTTNHFYKP